MKIEFKGNYDFEAIEAARDWCAENGYSVGSMQRGDPMGIKKGDYCIAKWRNLSNKDRNELDGIITGDKRSGPVTIEVWE